MKRKDSGSEISNYIYTESLEHRIKYVGRDLWRSLVQAAAQSRANLDEVFQAVDQLSFEYLQGWRF